MANFDYVRPNSVAEALQLLGDSTYTSRPLAGGTDVVVYLRHQPPPFNRLVDVSQLPELKTIRQEGETIVLGAAVSFTEALESKLLQKTVPFLVQACRLIGGPQIRNMGTIGGNIANAAACADTLPVLVCLEAVVHLESGRGKRQLPVSAFIVRPNKTQLQPDELITHFTFKAPEPDVKTVFIKIGRRNALAISRLTMALMIRLDKTGRIDFVRLTPGSSTPQTVRFTQAEQTLLGEFPTEALFNAVGRQVADSMIEITGRRWSTAYKEPALSALTYRALSEGCYALDSHSDKKIPKNQRSSS